MAERRRRRKLTDSEGSEESGEEQLNKDPSDLASDGGNSEYESIEEEEDDELDEEEDHVTDVTQEGINDSQVDKQLDDDEDRKNPQYIPKKGTFYEHDDRTMPGEEEEVETKEKETPAPAAPEKKEASKKKMWKEDDRWHHDRYSLQDQAPKSRDELVTAYGYDIRDEDGPPRARRRRRYGRGPNKYTRNWEDLDAYAKQQQLRGGRKPRGIGRGNTDVPIRSGRGRGRMGVGRSKRQPYPEEEFPALPHKDGPRDEGIRDDEENTSRVTVMNSQNENKYNAPVSGSEDRHERRTHRPFSPNEEKQRENIPRSGPGDGRPGASRRGTRSSYRGGRRYIEESQISNGRHSFEDSRGEAPRGRGENKRVSNVKDRLSNLKPQSHYQHRDMQEFTEEIKSMTITPSKEEYHFKSKRGIENRRNTIPPRLQETMRSGGSNSKSPSSTPSSSSPLHHEGGSVSKPKRYSSQRQRGVQEQGFQNQQGYFEQNSTEHRFQNNIYEGTQQNVISHNVTIQSSSHTMGGSGPPSFVAPSFTTSPATYPPEPFLGQTQSPRMFPPVSQSHILAPVPAGPPPPIAGATVPPTVAGPAAGVPGPPIPPVTGPPFLPPENMLNYPAGVVPPPLNPAQFQPFQAFTPVSQGQPQEIYSNGVMYYNTQSQQHIPRTIQPLQKRPKAAIPIVPPPERDPNEEKYTLGEHGEYLPEEYCTEEYEDSIDYKEENYDVALSSMPQTELNSVTQKFPLEEFDKVDIRSDTLPDNDDMCTPPQSQSETPPPEFHSISEPTEAHTAKVDQESDEIENVQSKTESNTDSIVESQICENEANLNTSSTATEIPKIDENEMKNSNVEVAEISDSTVSSSELTENKSILIEESPEPSS